MKWQMQQQVNSPAADSVLQHWSPLTSYLIQHPLMLPLLLHLCAMNITVRLCNAAQPVAEQSLARYRPPDEAAKFRLMSVAAEIQLQDMKKRKQEMQGCGGTKISVALIVQKTEGG